MTSRPGRDQGRPRVVLAPEIAEIAGSITNRMPDLVDRVVRRILTEIEFYRDRGVIGLEDIRGSVRDNLESMATELTTSQPPDLSAPRATGRRRAEQGTPLADILHAYRIGFTEFWEAIVEEGRRSTRATPDTLVDAASGVWWLIGEYTQELTVAYREAASELLLAAARERSALVEAVFTGGIPDRDTLWEAAKLLRLPWEGVFVVVAVEAPGLAQEGLPDAEAFLAGRGIGSAWHLHPDIQMGVVSLRHADALPVLLELLRRGVRARCGSARPTLPSATPPAPSTTPAWCWPACPPAPRRWSSSRRRRSACSPPPPRTRPGRWCARCWDRCSICPTRSVPACWAPCGRGSTPVARRPRPASGSTCTRTPSGTGCGGCRSTRDGPSTIPRPWPSCWPPWTPCGSCRSRARPGRRCRRGQPSRGRCCPAGHCARAPSRPTLGASHRRAEETMANLALNLVEAKEMYPDRVAVRLDELALTYSELDERSARGRACSPPVASPPATGSA